MKIFKSRKKKGFGLVHVIILLGVVAFASAIVVPMVTSRSELKPAKDVQIQSTKILNAAKKEINQDNLTRLGLPAGTPLTDASFDSIKVTNAVVYLNSIGALDNMPSENLTISNPALTLGNLKTIVNLPTNKLVVDSAGHLISYPAK